MNLEELLRSGIIRKTMPNSRSAVNSLKRAQRDICTARTLIESKELDWALAVSYNAMLLAARALMFSQGYRPSTGEGHLAVVRFLRASLGTEASDKMIMVFDRMRKKRHRIVYEEMDIVSEDEADQALKWAEEFVSRIDGMICGDR